MTVVMIQDVHDGGVVETSCVIGPFADDDAARAWADANVDERRVWAMESVVAPW